MFITTVKKALKSDSDKKARKRARKLLASITQFVRLPDGNSWYEYYDDIPDMIQMNRSKFDELWATHPEERPKVKMYNTYITSPRWQQAYGRDYTFSGQTAKALEIKDEYLVKLLAWVNRHGGGGYNGMLINFYDSGDDSIAAHSDKETDLTPGSAIYSFSFGQSRDFVIKVKKNSEYEMNPIKVELNDNSLIIMAGEMQQHYTHEVPKRSVTTCPGCRINITVRSFK